MLGWKDDNSQASPRSGMQLFWASAPILAFPLLIVSLSWLIPAFANVANRDTLLANRDTLLSGPNGYAQPETNDSWLSKWAEEKQYDLLLQALKPDAPMYVDSKDEMGKTALYYLAKYGQLQIARMLRDKGAAIDSRTVTGATPLMIACAHRQVQMVKWLLSQGASVTAIDAAGLNALDFAGDDGTLVRLLMPFLPPKEKTDPMDLLRPEEFCSHGAPPHAPRSQSFAIASFNIRYHTSFKLCPCKWPVVSNFMCSRSLALSLNRRDLRVAWAWVPFRVPPCVLPCI